MTGLLRYARQEAVALKANAAHGFAARHALVHYPSGAVYSFIPKNACSTLRYSLACANNCINDPQDWVWIHPNNATFAATLPELVRAPFSFVILRCPHARLASVFLDKIVDKTPELWQLYRLSRDGFDPDTLTFRDFVALLCDADKLNSNIHWRPQVDFLVYETYTHVFALERFSTIAGTVRAAIGFDILDARTLTGHGTDAVDLIRKGAFADTPLHMLAAMKRDGQLPAHARLYDDRLARKVASLYAADMNIYAKNLGPKDLTFSNLITD
jgi:hypothetical protein